MEWQPIETAPKDGTKVDVWVHWLNHPGFRKTDVFWRDEWMYHCPRDQDNYRVEGYALEVTHWMPLPEPPPTPTAQE